MKQKFIHRTVSAFLALSAVFSLSSCSNFIIINEMSDKGNANSPTGTSEFSQLHETTEFTEYVKTEDNKALAEKYFDSVRKQDFDGAAFFITTPSTDYIDPDNTETNINKEILERNEKVEEAYNCSVYYSVAETSTMYNAIKDAVKSDTYYSDMMMVPVYMLGSFSGYRTLYNLRSVPFLNLDEPYFFADSVEMTSAGYKTYGVAGYASLSPETFTGVYFNRDMIESAKLEMPYSYVVNGTWTWDKLLEYTKNVECEHSFASENDASRLADLVFISSGCNYIRSQESSVPAIGFTVSSTKKTISTLYSITKSGVLKENAIDAFGNGQALFLIDYLSEMSTLSDSKADWGILPLPKNNETQEYRTLVSNNELVFTIPANHTNTEAVAMILCALNAASYKYLNDEFVDYNLIHVLRDNDSANMLDLILDTPAFDFALAFGNAYPTIGQATYLLIREAAKTGDLQSIYIEAVNTAKNTLKTYFGLSY